MLNRLFASTAVAALIASGAYAQTDEAEEPQVQTEQQDRLAPAMGQEIAVRDGDTVTLESGDVEFAIRVRSTEPSAVPGQDLAAEPEAAEDMAAAESDAGNDAAIDTGEDTGTDSAPAVTDSLGTDAGEAGQGQVVSNGDVLVVTSEGEDFQLSFEIGAADGTAATGTSTDGSAISTVDREDLQARALDQIRADDLIGSSVYGAGDERIGNVGDVILTQDGQVDALLVDVGGFLGIGSREVAVGLDRIEFMVDDRENWYVYTPFTKEQIEGHAEYDASTYSDQRDEQLLIVR